MGGEVKGRGASGSGCGCGWVGYGVRQYVLGSMPVRGGGFEWVAIRWVGRRVVGGK